MCSSFSNSIQVQAVACNLPLPLHQEYMLVSREIIMFGGECAWRPGLSCLALWYVLPPHYVHSFFFFFKGSTSLVHPALFPLSIYSPHPFPSFEHSNDSPRQVRECRFPAFTGSWVNAEGRRCGCLDCGTSLCMRGAPSERFQWLSPKRRVGDRTRCSQKPVCAF